MKKIIDYVPLALFCLYFGKIGVLGASYPDALVLLFMAGLLVAREWQVKNKQIIELKEESRQLSVTLAEQKKEIQEIRSYVTGQKLGGLRTTQSVRTL